MSKNPSIPLTFARSTLAIAVALTASHSSAQLMLEEVVVTAQKREQSLQDVPTSVSALSSEMLSQTNTTNFGDLSKITSGVNITGGQNGFGGVIRIRGVGTNAFAPAVRPSVGIFVDEVPLVDISAAYNNLADVERVEILKGPQATLFGKEVSSGAIALATKRPNTEEIGAYVEGNFGNLALAEYRLGGNLPLGDMFAVRASVYHNERDGIVDNLITGTEMGSYDKDGGRIRLLFEPNDVFSAILSYEYHETESLGSFAIGQQYGDLAFSSEALLNPNGPSLLTEVDPFDRKNKNSNPSNKDNKTENIYLNMEWAINDTWTLNSVTSDQTFELHTKGQFPTADGFLAADTSFGPYPINDFINDVENTSTTQELRATYNGDKLSSIVGVFYAESDLINETPFTSMLGIIPDPANPVIKAAGFSDLRENIEEYAIFNHNIYSINDGLDLIFGIRASEVEKTSSKSQLTGVGPFASLNSPFVPVINYPDGVPEQNDSWDDITGTLKVNWYMTDDVSVYAGWARGFKAGGHNVTKTDNNTGLALAVEPFDSETADNFEVGFKGRFGDSLTWNGALFHQAFDDYQVDIADEAGIGNSIQNAASVEITGIETDFQWLASERFLLDGSVSYVDARWDEYDNAECLRPQYQAIACDPLTNTQDLSGKRLNFTSPWSLNLNATYTYGLQNGMEISARAEYAYRDDVFFFPDLDPDATADGYSLVNASLGLSSADGSWDVLLWAKNLLDEDYLEGAARNRDASNPNFGGTPAEGYRVTVGAEATYGLTLKYRFGAG